MLGILVYIIYIYTYMYINVKPFFRFFVWTYIKVVKWNVKHVKAGSMHQYNDTVGLEHVFECTHTTKHPRVDCASFKVYVYCVKNPYTYVYMTYSGAQLPLYWKKDVLLHMYGYVDQSPFPKLCRKMLYRPSSWQAASWRIVWCSPGRVECVSE